MPESSGPHPLESEDLPGGVEDPGAEYAAGGAGEIPDESEWPDSSVRPGRSTYELAGYHVELRGEMIYIHDVDSGKPRLVKHVDWARETVLTEFYGPDELLRAWADPDGRKEVLLLFRSRHIDLRRLVEELGASDNGSVDSVDYLLRLAWDVPQLTRAERARNVRQKHVAEIERLSGMAQQVVLALLDVYGTSGVDEISSTAVLQVAPFAEMGSPVEIARSFGGPDGWHKMRRTVQEWLYGT